ncbi:uncharacterized protein CELE_F16B3.2 [Caenorhabditis elegans]|uniref:Secreted protein n=1 Tax=Caenorhabditis elegans TaxID=6239 RepID=Q6EZH0_CAEEL|nr:Secreted protein [Caenorhabditis elegans]CCD69555.2 Secreted protein [Caenorhabditis elegans]|eukprot:NP_503403.3 Uncharacterized protein CELE_F16B3.2 [Caenorhabditis elegans]
MSKNLIFSLILSTVFIAKVSGVVDDATRQKVQDALLEALAKISSVTEPSVPEGSIISSQNANEDSKKLQFNSEVLELASQILVEKYGVEILDAANVVLQELQSETTTAESK